MQQHKFQVSIKSRRGRNGLFTLDNHSPERIHKTREIVVKSEVPCEVQVRLAVCGLANDIRWELGHTCSPNSCTTPNSITKTISKTDKEKEAKVYLHTKVDGPATRPHVVYKVSISVTIRGYTQTLHSWEATPVKGHKFESSKKGKAQRANNCEVLNTCISIPNEEHNPTNTWNHIPVAPVPALFCNSEVLGEYTNVPINEIEVLENLSRMHASCDSSDPYCFLSFL